MNDIKHFANIEAVRQVFPLYKLRKADSTSTEKVCTFDKIEYYKLGSAVTKHDTLWRVGRFFKMVGFALVNFFCSSQKYQKMTKRSWKELKSGEETTRIYVARQNGSISAELHVDNPVQSGSQKQETEVEIQYPTEHVTEKSILNWRTKAKPQELLKNFSKLFSDFAGDTILETAPYEAFKRICRDPNIDDQAILKMMQDMKDLPTTLIQNFAEKLTEEEWKRVAVICLSDSYTLNLFDRMRVGLENPSFLFAYCPAKQIPAFCFDLFKLTKTKPDHRDEALEAYFSSPHYQRYGTSGLRTFHIGEGDKEAKQAFLDYIIENAPPAQLLDLSLIHEDFQEPVLKKKVQEIPLSTLLDVYYQASQGRVANSAQIIDKAKQLIRQRCDHLSMNEELTTLTILQGIALFLVYFKNSMGQQIFHFYTKNDRKMGRVFEYIGSAAHPRRNDSSFSI